MALDAPRLLTPVTPSSSGPLRPVFPSHAIRPSLSCPIAGIFPKIQTFLLSPFLLPAGPSLYTLPGYAVSWPLDLWVLSAPSASSSRASPLLASQGIFLEPRMVLSLPLALPALTPPPTSAPAPLTYPCHVIVFSSPELLSRTAIDLCSAASLQIWRSNPSRPLVQPLLSPQQVPLSSAVFEAP